MSKIFHLTNGFFSFLFMFSLFLSTSCLPVLRSTKNKKKIVELNFHQPGHDWHLILIEKETESEYYDREEVEIARKALEESVSTSVWKNWSISLPCLVIWLFDQKMVGFYLWIIKIFVLHIVIITIKIPINKNFYNV